MPAVLPAAAAPAPFALLAAAVPGDGGSEAIVVSDLTLGDWLLAGVVVAGSVVVAALLRRSVRGLLQRGMARDSFAEVLVGRLVQWVVILIGLFYALSVLGVQIAPLLGALGLGGIAIALALQPTLQNLFAGIILHAQRPVRLGDEVITGTVRGVVTDITSRAVVVRTPGDETVYIPNSTVLDRDIVNLVRERRRRTTVTVGVAYDTDLPRARDVILRAAAGVAGVLDDPEPRVYAKEFADSSINFDVDIWHGPEERVRREVRSDVVLAIHRALGEAGITIPFPQRTLWFGQAPEQARESDVAEDGGPAGAG